MKRYPLNDGWYFTPGFDPRLPQLEKPEGEFEPVRQEQPGLAAFVRAGGGRRLLIASNLSGKAQRLELPGTAKEVLLCNDGVPVLAGNVLTLAPWQAAVVELA